MGHCAVLVNSTIYYIGGIDSTGVAIIDIQTYDVERNVWNVIGHRQMTRHFYNFYSRSFPFFHLNCLVFAIFTALLPLSPEGPNAMGKGILIPYAHVHK